MTSNKVILELLNRLIEEARIFHRVFRGRFHESRDRLHENHPLVNFIERRLSQRFAIAGGLKKCPELERKIKEAKENDPEGFKRLIYDLVGEYYGREPAIPEPELVPWVRKKKRLIEVTLS